METLAKLSSQLEALGSNPLPRSLRLSVELIPCSWRAELPAILQLSVREHPQLLHASVEHTLARDSPVSATENLPYIKFLSTKISLICPFCGTDRKKQKQQQQHKKQKTNKKNPLHLKGSCDSVRIISHLKVKSAI